MRTRRPARAIWLLVLGLILGGGLPASSAEEPRPTVSLTLKDIIRIALERNAGFRAAQLEVDASERGLDIARGRRLGRADLFGAYQYAGPDAENRRRAGALVGAMPLLRTGGMRPDQEFSHNTGAFGVRYRIPIYTGGRLAADVELNELATVFSRDRLQATRDDLVFNASSVYYTILRFREDIRATETSVRALEESRRVIEERVAVGREPKVTLLKINARLAAVQQDLIRVRNAFERAHGALNALMGAEDITAPVEVIGTLEYAPAPRILPESIAEGLERNPELRARRRAVEIQERRVRIAFAERLPDVSLGAAVQGLASEGLGTNTLVPDATVDVRVSLPIFDGKVIRSRVEQERARLERARAEVEQLKREVALEVETAYLNIVSAEERIGATRAAIEEAREARRIEQLKQELGRGIIEDLLLAQAAELEAEENYFSALADYNIAGVALEKAIGGVE
ncbi:MAG: TolC family protein [candidate division NC10 bacterium]|nr:TolC family protein [candidate division NC10 bacterium]